MKQKTAIDFLIEELMFESVLIFTHLKENPETIEKAKAKFREQIEDAYNQGEENTECCYDGQKINGIDGSDYYQQKYGDEK